MLPYKHYSFDLWLTLIRSHPEFKKKRSMVFYEKFNHKAKTLPEVEHIFRQVDLMCNFTNERTGKNIDADEMYLMVISLLNDNDIDLHDIDVDAVLQDMEQLLFAYLPRIYCNKTADVLSHIKDGGATTNILSNTGFIKGATLRKVLQQIGLYDLIDLHFYSDEVGMSKPNPALYELMIDGVSTLHPQLSKADIIHVGDNPRADVAGALAVGINAMLVNSDQTSITSLTSQHEHQHIFPS
jgi:putative hydrolase of the HAD superfamily